VSWIQALARPDIAALKAYAHAAWEPELTRLHANELPWRTGGDDSAAGLNRYPEPQPRALIGRLAELYSVPPDRVLVGRGSDEAIDLLVRAFCRAERDAVLICPPTFGMYAVAAQIQGAHIVTVPLVAADGFALNESAVLEACEEGVKIVFLCSPNNPTGNILATRSILTIAAALEGRALVVVDEAYIEFSGSDSLASRVAMQPNLVVLRTLSKAHGLAGARCGTLIGNPEVVALLRKVISPYAIPQLTLETVLKLLAPVQSKTTCEQIAAIRAERGRVSAALSATPGIKHVWSSAANFLLVEFADAESVLRSARAASLLVRDVRGYPGLGSSLRITIGSVEENTRLLKVLT
jgi:histidinol-phosphate aminotransferase